MEAKIDLLKRAALSGVLDTLPLDVLKVYLLLIAWARDVGVQSRVPFQMMQDTLQLSHEDCQRALAHLASQRLLAWEPVQPRASRRRHSRGMGGQEITFLLNPLHELEA
ncbi:MAG: hypothetical protein ACREOH_22235 [Candidatus Entotheonellia bacterium]